MKAINEDNGRKLDKGSLGEACLKSCKAIVAQIGKVRAAMVAEARDTLKLHEQALQLALAEAEALAMQTLYPQLVFPALAQEKVQRAAHWDQRQRALKDRLGS